MYIAKDESRRTLLAESYDGNTACFCPDCGELLVFKRCPNKGKAPHFAHKANTRWKYCRDADYKTEWHRQMQGYFDNQYLERTFIDPQTKEKHIADVFIPESNTVIEFQHSRIHSDEFLSRTKFHLENGRRILWVFDGKRDFGNMDNQNLSLDMLDMETEEYRDQTYKWNSYQLTALQDFNKERIAGLFTDSNRFSICIDTGEDEGTVHRIVNNHSDYSFITFSKQPIRMTHNMNTDCFFALDPYFRKKWLDIGRCMNRLPSNRPAAFISMPQSIYSIYHMPKEQMLHNNYKARQHKTTKRKWTK